jgi:hypothetical protein
MIAVRRRELITRTMQIGEIAVAGTAQAAG